MNVGLPLLLQTFIVFFHSFVVFFLNFWNVWFYFLVKLILGDYFISYVLISLSNSVAIKNIFISI